MTTWYEVEVGNHQFQIGALDTEPTTVAAETDVFVVSRSGLLMVRTGIAAGPASVAVALHPSAPPVDLDGWDNVAETTVAAAQEMYVMSIDGDVYEELGPIPASGAVSVRVSARGRAANWDHVVDDASEKYLIDAWPGDGAAATRQLKSSDGMWMNSDAAESDGGHPGVSGVEDATARLFGPMKTPTPRTH